MPSVLSPGLVGTAFATVTGDNTAQAMGSGLVPVFATPALVALVEEAAVRALAGHLQPGQTSVGTHVDLRHLAATPVGLKVRAQATLRQVDGRRLTFDVIAHDDVEQIAEGQHTRFLVDEERFLTSAARKATQGRQA